MTLEPRETRSTVGSGDAFLAGFVAARYTGSPPEECLRFGVACGAESTQHFGAGVLDPREVERLMPEVEVEELPAVVAYASPTPQYAENPVPERQRPVARLTFSSATEPRMPPWK